MEVWKEVKGYEGLYEVSDKGRVRGLDRIDPSGKFVKGVFMKLREDKDGYYRVNLSKHSKKKHYRINRLVAENFLENPNSLPVVNHIDGNKQNNCVENLEWCTRSENDLHAFRLGLRKVTSGGTDKPVAKVDPITNNIIDTYSSLSEAARLNDISLQAISYNANGKIKLTKGYKWIFIDEGVTTIESTLI